MRKLLPLFVLGLLLLSGCKRAAEETIIQEEVKKEPEVTKTEDKQVNRLLNSTLEI